MPQAFVTGGTGFIGRHLMDVLAEEGWAVTALLRNPDDARLWPSAGVTPVVGDLTDPDSVRAAMPDSCDRVFHVAADTSAWFRHRNRQERINVDGTQAIIDACRATGAKRLVHVSTVAVWGDWHETISETLPQKGKDHWVGYVRTKYEAEQRVKAADDLSAVICNPGHVVGAYDANNWGRLFRMIETGSLPGCPPGGGSFANARKVAEALRSAADRGAEKENYLLGGPHMRFAQVTELAASMINKKTPRTLPAFVLKGLAQVNEAVSRFTNKEPDLTPESAYFICHDEHMDSSKAERDLGYELVPVEQSLRQCRDWQLAKEAGNAL